MGDLVLNFQFKTHVLFCDKKKFFIHINTTNPALLEDSLERKKANEEGWEVSYDGMEVNL